MDYVLEADTLTKIYGHHKALDNFSMHIPQGAIYGLVGKNGAGKTTLLRLICGLQEATSGEYTLYGISSRKHEVLNARKEMGAVIETPAIYLDMSATGNLKEQYRVLGIRTLAIENGGPGKHRMEKGKEFQSGHEAAVRNCDCACRKSSIFGA